MAAGETEDGVQPELPSPRAFTLPLTPSTVTALEPGNGSAAQGGEV